MPKKPRLGLRPAPSTSNLTLDTCSLNAILAGLSVAEVAMIPKSATLVDLAVEDQIYLPDATISEVVFPIDCVLSVVTRMKDGRAIEVGTIGREGVSALPLLLGGTTTANECYCQVPGSAIKMGAAAFRKLLDGSSKFSQLLDRYVQAYVNMLGQLAACNRLHTVYERCSRWLLMTHDRVGTPRIRLTHEYLAMMLGSQRSGVTIAAATLQNAGFIRYAHGVITILDRPGLENASYDCYAVARDQFAPLLASVRGNATQSAARVIGVLRRKKRD